MGIRLNKDIVTGGILLVFSMILYFFIIPKEISHTSNEDIYPKFFTIMSVIIIAGLLFYLGIRNWIKIFCLCSGFLILVYLLFEKGLSVRLPRGFL